MYKTYTYPELSEKLNIKAPLLMLDRLTLNLDEAKATALKMVSMNEFVFSGHFPGEPVMPGVLQVAAMAQASRMILEQHHPSEKRSTVVGMRKVKFRKPVQPGMTLLINAELMTETEDGTFEFKITNTVDGETASSGIIAFRQMDAAEMIPQAAECVPCPLPPEFTGEISNAAAIMQSLPHRQPFMLIDQAANLGNGISCCGYKNITGNDILMAGSPEKIYPGYLQVEAGAQLGCAHILKQPGNAGKLGLFMSIDEAVFHRHVLAGDRLDIFMSCEFGGRFGIATGTFKVADTVVTEMKFKFAILEGMGK